MRDTLQLPSDLPLDEAGLRRHSDYRLQPVIDMLCSHLHDWQTTPRAQRREPMRLGLFGGLGQGKSTVAGVALARLHRGRTRAQRLREALLGPAVARFDVSFFKADDLEWRFFTAVLFRRTLRNLLLLALPLALLIGLTGWAGAALVDHFDWHNSEVCRTERWRCAGGISTGWGAALVVVLAAAVKWGKVAWRPLTAANPAQGLYVALKDLAMQFVAQLVFALPDVVVVDDLDRARVEQQRSFLRAITRYSRSMSFAVVVCMDDAELLAAPANPEAPDELLRKNITAELRVPERSREDVALLGAVEVREFCNDNAQTDPALCHGLRSVQFVGDFARVLLLDDPGAPNSPRKLRRLLTQLALQARQLALSDADDLSALLRLEGLYRLAPALRQHLDPLRRALESNRLQVFEPLLAELALPAQRHATALQFFSRTRMMNPALRDGWFRLLGGFDRQPDQLRVQRRIPQPWVARWDIRSRSVDLLRVFVEAAGHDASGYPHPLMLPPSPGPDRDPDADPDAEPDVVSPPEVFAFELPGGTREIFDAETLPEAVRNGSGEYAACCWLAWICALRGATPERRHALCHRAWRWADTVAEDRREAVAEFVLREALADSEMWAVLQPSQRDWWWDRVHGRDAALDRALSMELRDEDFADAWRVLGRSDGNGVFRDGRKVLAWWGHLVPQVDDRRLGDGELTDAVFGSAVWPAPDVLSANTAQARNLLARHLLALNALRTVPGHARVPNPQPLREALRRALDELLPEHLLELLGPLAFDGSAPPGERWSLEVPRRWIDDVRHHDTHARLRRFVVDADAAAFPGWDAQRPTPAQRRALLALALVCGWEPRQPARITDGLDAAELQELKTLTEDRGSPCAWL